MNGAGEYGKIFRSGQHGKLFLVSSSHARGRTFHIWVLPEGVQITDRPWYEPRAVEVYGITGGNQGWTETNGWQHKGPWQEDFFALVVKRLEEIAAVAAQKEQERSAREAEAVSRKAALLAAY